MKEKIYFIPGLMTDKRLWKRLFPLLNDYELIHIDIPNLENFDEINKILDCVFDDKKINIIGFSLGSYIASYYAVKNPKKVNKVFNISGTPSATEDKNEIEKRKQKVIQMVKGFKPLGRQKAISLLEKENQNDEELIFIVEDMFDNLGKETFISQMNSTFNRVDILDELTALDIPIWYYYNINDRLLNKKSIKQMEEKGHNLNLLSYNFTGHNIPLEHPKELSKQIISWMNK